MDRIAIISDIHGNMPALKAVLDDIQRRQIKRIICLGDLVGKGPNPAETMETIKDKCEFVIKGNWDYYITEQRGTEVNNWYRQSIGKERLEYLKSLESYVEFYMSGKLIRLCHASPNDIFHRVHIWSPVEERLKLFEPTRTLNAEAEVVGYGDIHGAYIDTFAGKTLFNTGSVGNPLDITQASYAVIEGKYQIEEYSPFAISLLRVPYDIEQAVKDALMCDMPEKEEYIRELRTAVYRGRKE